MFDNTEPTYEELRKKRFESAKRKAQSLNRRINLFVKDIDKSFLSNKEKKQVYKDLNLKVDEKY